MKMKRYIKAVVTATILGTMPATLSALPAKPGIHTVEQPDGTTIDICVKGDARNHRVYSADGQPLIKNNEGFYVPDTDGNFKPSRKAYAPDKAPRKGPGLFGYAAYPSHGVQKGVAILVEFPNCQFKINDPQDYFYRMLNEPGFRDYGGTGSARDYFINNSSGIFMPEFDVFGPVMLPENYEHYGSGDEIYAAMMIAEACEAVDKDVNFKEYDRDHDGVIDNVYVFYAGYGEADSFIDETVWPHSWDLSSAKWLYPEAGYRDFYFDDVLLDHYACSNELQYYGKQPVIVPDGIGTFVHEFSHVLGLPDLYQTLNGPTAFTPGLWSVLDVGNYNNNSRTPPNYSTFERYALDWISPEELTSGTFELEELGESNTAFIISTDDPNEMFFIENRQPIGNDLFLPGRGMLAWHLHYNENIWNENLVNSYKNSQRVDLIEADKILDWNTLPGDSFPGESNVTSLSSDSHPAFRRTDGSPLPIEINDIAENGYTLSFSAVKEEESGIAGIEVDDDSAERIYDLMGREITRPTGGIYIVRSGSTVKKMVMK